MLRAMAEAMFAQDGEVDHTTLEAHLDDVDTFISSASRALRVGLRLALFVVRIAPLLLFFRMRTLERLSVDERVAVLSRLERSRIANLSLAFIGWRSVMTLVFYESPTELATAGYVSDERKVYKRHLAMLVPVPDDSGVRLRDLDVREHDRDSDPPHEHAPEEPAVAPPGKTSREVA